MALYSGDHGGESEEEVTAGFFVYSKQPLLNLDGTKDSVKQVDIVPTLAAILGVPIPFQNLGILIPNCLPITNESFEIETWRLVLYHLWVNVNQVQNYIKEYSESTNTFNEDILNKFYQMYFLLKTELISVNNEEHFLHLYEDIVNFLFNLRKMCENVWIQFDSFSMTRGLLFLFTSLFFVFVITDGIPYNRLSEIFMSSFVLCSCIMLFLAAASGFVLYYFEIVDSLLSVIIFFTGIVSQMIFVILIVQNWELISLNWYDRNKKEKIPNLICRIVLAFNICGLFSNSYIIEESFVLLFLLITVILVGTAKVTLFNNMNIKCRSNLTNILKWPKLKLLLFSVCIATLVRVSMYFWRCREEQQWCFGNPHEVSNITVKIETTKIQWAIAVISLAVFVFMTKEWLRNCGNLNGYSLTVILVKFVPTVIVVCIGGYWVLKRLPSNKRQPNPFKFVEALAWLTYALTLFGIVATIIKPLCTYIIPGRNFIEEENKISILFKKIKSTLLEQQQSNEEIPIICGLGSVYSTAFIIIGIYVTLIFSLLLSDTFAPSAVIMFLTAAFILIITAVLRIEKATSQEELFDIPNILILVWIILAQYFFYAFGHQPTFPNISWEAAFIGTSGIFFSHIIQGTLIIINTFCSYILMGLLLPLLLITPFTVFIMIPSVVGKKPNDLQLISTKGEMGLIERNNLMLSSIFVLSCKYIMGHGIRMHNILSF
ncbi:GPI ethanolamine phosphate transferase 3 [Anoplophora glabripennis]|uniref:GPI ethanolamine phosphate transferase 3 n=1 Tax=Anoplophora glabripennis TaxID=217634 RepID=UPI000C758E6B|nr:GPI ethanolamine phosphate transferase 3 [Anoplophora glabripennis]